MARSTKANLNIAKPEVAYFEAAYNADLKVSGIRLEGTRAVE